MAWVKPRQRSDGSWYYCVFFREDNPRTGKRQQSSISWDDPNDAEHCANLIDQLGAERAREVLRIVQSPRHSETLRQYLQRHNDTLTGVEDGTLARYRAYVRNDIGPVLGDLPLTALSRDDIQRWIQQMSGSGKTMKNKRDYLSGALKLAVKQGRIKANPCEDVSIPRWDRQEMVFLTRDEFQIVLAEIPDYWKPLVEFLVVSGCRWSEATALKPAAVDRNHHTVRITKAWKTGAGGYTLGMPKTQRSVRTIDVPAKVLDKLDYGGEWLFTNSGRGKGQFADGVTRSDDNPVRIHSFHPNVWTPAVERAQKNGLTKKPRVHDLRHTCASWLIQGGRNLLAVQAHLGHESIKTTSDVYGHLDRTSGKDNAAVLGAMLTSD